MPIDYPESVDIQDLNDEVWFDIVNRTVTPKESKMLDDVLVQNDANSRNFGFMIQRYFENIDLSTKSIRIHYVNSLNEHDKSNAHSIKIVGGNQDVISFMWLIEDKVCIETGNVEFAIEFYDTDGFSWFTKPTNIKVTQGIYTVGEIVAPEDWYKILRNECDDKLDKNQGADNKDKVMVVDENGNVKPQVVPNFTPIKIKNIELTPENWDGANPYSQNVSIDGVSALNKIDIQLTPEQLNYLQTKDISLMAANTNGAVTIYAMGAKPEQVLNLQVTITEVIAG